MDVAAMFAGIAQGISAQFGGPYVDGVVIDQTGAVFDDGGSITIPGSATERACQVQVDLATEAMRQSDGFADGDARFLILAATLDGGLNTDATVQVLDGPLAGSWLVSAIERDPCGIYWQGRGRRST
jgi:hypothetical protein